VLVKYILKINLKIKKMKTTFTKQITTLLLCSLISISLFSQQKNIKQDAKSSKENTEQTVQTKKMTYHEAFKIMFDSKIITENEFNELNKLEDLRLEERKALNKNKKNMSDKEYNEKAKAISDKYKQLNTALLGKERHRKINVIRDGK
jgi:hypothetical protein